MYRGPGFERFHPVLGSVAGHKEICDEWDARQLKLRNGTGQTRIPFRPGGSGTDDGSTSTNVANDQADGTPFSSGRGFLDFDRRQEQRCLEQVLVVFPQVQHDFVRKLFRERHPGGAELLLDSKVADTTITGAIIAEIAERESFPKQKDLKRKHSPTALDSQDVTVKWNRDALKNETYYTEALILLADKFTRIPTHFINRMLREKGTLFDTFHFLAESENTYNNSPYKPYSRSKLGRVALEKKYQRSAAQKREGHQYVSIVNEFQAARQQQHREETRQKRQKADDEAEASNFALHELQGSLVDCQCCFNEAPINRVVNCENDETHFFCKRCIETRAKAQIGSLKYEMVCMDTSDCGAGLSKEALARTLPVKISDKLAEIQQLAEIKAAGLDGLEHCPFCEYQAICAPVDVDTIFECLNPDCEKVSCRKCKDESHVPRSCEEAQKDRGLSARHAVEEARSEAMMRSCPRCKVKIVKSAGCNKMTCSNCRAVMCYVCKKDITGWNYEHFSSGPTACPMQDSSAEDRHQQEADDAENAAIAAVKARDSGVNEEDLRIEAHLNQQPGHERETAHHRETYGPQAGFHLPAVPQYPLMGAEHHHLLAGPERARIDAIATDRFYQALDEARQRRDRVGGMLQDQQQQLHRLQPFLPAQAVPPPPLPAMPGHGLVPPVHNVRQHLQLTYPRPVVAVTPTYPPRNPFNIEANGGLAPRMQGFLQRDPLPTFGRDVAYNNHNDPLPPYGHAFAAQQPPPSFNDDLRYPRVWGREPDDAPNTHDNGFAQARQQQNQA
jgi:IBR domain, a half RING-finger domain